MANPLVVVHDHINGALDALALVDPDAHGRETGQVEYKLNEAKLWLGVVPGAITAITADAETVESTEDDTAGSETPHGINATPPAVTESTPVTAAPEPAPAPSPVPGTAPKGDPTADLPIP